MPETAARFDVPPGIYAMSHSVGCLPKSARQALEAAYLTPWADKGGGAWPDWLAAVDGFRTALAGLFNSRPDLFCPQTTVSDGFYNLLTALPPSTGKHVLMHADAFPSLGFVVHGLAERGFSLQLLDSDPGDLDAWDAALEAADIALITHAHSNTGQLSPVTELSALCRARGVHCIVDIAQSAGIIPIDFDSWNADAVIGSCVKWLCGGPGAGYLWTNENWLGELTPERLGWFSHENPFEFDIANFRAADSALKFWGGTPSIAPYVLAQAGIEEIASIGSETVRAHNLDLMRACLEAAGLSERSIDVDRHTGTLCLDVPPATIASAKAALDTLGCHHDWRGEAVRLSFHVFNTRAEAEKVGRALGPFIS